MALKFFDIIVGKIKFRSQQFKENENISVQFSGRSNDVFNLCGVQYAANK